MRILPNGFVGIGYSADPAWDGLTAKMAINGNLVTNGTGDFVTGIYSPSIVGGTATGSGLILQATTAAGSVTNGITFKVGSGGGVTPMVMSSTGLTSIGALTPSTSYLTIGAGGASSVVPLVINNGTLRSTPVPNAIENDGTNLYYTTSAGSRAILGGGTSLNGTGLVRMSGTSVSYDNTSYVSGTPWTAVGYVISGGALGTPSSGTLTNCTFPTLNQNTTGSAAKLTTSRTIAGTSFDGSANITLANKFIVQGTSDSGLSGAQYLGSLATGLLKNTTSTGVLSIATSADIPGLPNNTVQALSGTSITWNTTNGLNATLTLTGNTTLTLSNLVAGQTGNIRVTNAASTYTLTMAGYTNKFSPTIYLTTNQVKTSGSSKIDVYSFFYDGTYLIWNGTQGYL